MLCKKWFCSEVEKILNKPVDPKLLMSSGVSDDRRLHTWYHVSETCVAASQWPSCSDRLKSGSWVTPQRNKEWTA